MPELLVLSFTEKKAATAALKRLVESKAKETYAAINDACIVERRRDGSLNVEQVFEKPARYVPISAAAGAGLGLISGILVGAPILSTLFGGCVGAGLAAIYGALTDHGIHNDFIQTTGSRLQVGQSALYLLGQGFQRRGLMDMLAEFNPTLVHSAKNYPENR